MVGVGVGFGLLVWAATVCVVAALALAGFAGTGPAFDAGAELAAVVADEAAGLAAEAEGLAEDAAGLADEAAGLADAAAALASGLGLAEAAGAAARVSRIAGVTAVVPAAEPACGAPAGAGDERLDDTSSVHGMAAGAAAVRCATGNSMPTMPTATTENPAKTLAAGAPAVRILTPPASRHAPRQGQPR